MGRYDDTFKGCHTWRNPDTRMRGITLPNGTPYIIGDDKLATLLLQTIIEVRAGDRTGSERRLAVLRQLCDPEEVEVAERAVDAIEESTRLQQARMQ